jgi:hypothetical protein
MILGLERMHYQSFAPLEQAGMFLDQMEDDWPGKKRMTEE